MSDDKPTLMLLNPRTATFDDLIEFVRLVTGREPSPDDLEKSRREWEEFQAELHAEDKEGDTPLIVELLPEPKDEPQLADAPPQP